MTRQLDELPGRTGVFTLSLASVLWSTGLALVVGQAVRQSHNYEMSESQTIVHAMLSVVLKWRMIVLAAELIGLYSTLANYGPGLKIWAIAVGADWVGQVLLLALGFLIRFHSQLSQPFGDLLCSELTRGEFFQTATVETCEESWQDAVTCALAVGGVYLAVKGVTVAIIFNHFARFKAAMAKAAYDEWTYALQGKTSHSRSRSSSSFSRRRSSSSSSGSSYNAFNKLRAESLPTYASLEAGHPPGLGKTISGRRKSHTVSSGSPHPQHSSHRPRLVLVPVFYEGGPHPSSSHIRSSSRSSISSHLVDSPSTYSPESSRQPPSYAYDAPDPFSTPRGRAASAGSASYPSRHWDHNSLGSLGTRRLSFLNSNGGVQHVASGRHSPLGSQAAVAGGVTTSAPSDVQRTIVDEPELMTQPELMSIKV